MRWPTLSPLMIHISNGVSTNKRTGGRLKKLGVMPGVPDLVLFYAAKESHGLFIEMKAKKGSVSTIQKQYHTLLRQQGYRVEVAYGAEQAVLVCKDYLSDYKH